MSYSRWINSDFYTYWCSSQVYDRGDELFALHCSLDATHMFTYTECNKILGDGTTLVEKVKDVQLTYEDVEELRGYMRQFIYDVDLSYDKKLINLRGGQ